MVLCASSEPSDVQSTPASAFRSPNPALVRPHRILGSNQDPNLCARFYALLEGVCRMSCGPNIGFEGEKDFKKFGRAVRGEDLAQPQRKECMVWSCTYSQ